MITCDLNGELPNVSDSKDSSTRNTAYSMGVERVLQRATEDAAFYDDLKKQRAKAAQQAGFDLSPSERAVLEAISPSQLDDAVTNLKGLPILDAKPPQPIEPFPGRPIPRGCVNRPARVAVSAAVVTAAAVGLYGATRTLGHTADLPPDQKSTNKGMGSSATQNHEGGVLASGAVPEEQKDAGKSAADASEDDGDKWNGVR